MCSKTLEGKKMSSKNLKGKKMRPKMAIFKI